MDTTSRHILIELWEGDSSLLNNLAYVSKCLSAAATFIGVNIVKEVFHEFRPQGITGVIVIEESHISIHTWPECGYAAIDVFTCGKHDPQKIIPIIKNKFRAKRCTTLKIIRGMTDGFKVLEPKVNR